MRLYLYAESKNKIGYTPDCFEVRNGKFRREYSWGDGETDFSDSGLDTRTKAVLCYYDEKKDDLVKLTRRQAKHLLKLLKDPKSEVTVNVYPQTTDDEDLAKNDILTNTSGTLVIYDEQVDFNNFNTAFYGF